MKVESEHYRSIWLGDSGVDVHIVDQTELPNKFVVRKLTNLEETANAINENSIDITGNFDWRGTIVS